MYEAMGCARLWGDGMKRMNTPGPILTSWTFYFSREACLQRIVCYKENGRPHRLSNLAKVTQLVGGREDRTNLKTILLPVNQRFSDSWVLGPLYTINSYGKPTKSFCLFGFRYCFCLSVAVWLLGKLLNLSY